MPEQTIEIDCAPGSRRPDSYIGKVIEGTGLPAREPSGKLFGNWTWNYSDIPEDVFNAAKPVLAERLVALYNSGAIRYASW